MMTRCPRHWCTRLVRGCHCDKKTCLAETFGEGKHTFLVATIFGGRRVGFYRKCWRYGGGRGGGGIGGGGGRLVSHYTVIATKSEQAPILPFSYCPNLLEDRGVWPINHSVRRLLLLIVARGTLCLSICRLVCTIWPRTWRGLQVSRKST
jgi:hypothetical protein